MIGSESVLTRVLPLALLWEHLKRPEVAWQLPLSPCPEHSYQYECCTSRQLQLRSMTTEQTQVWKMMLTKGERTAGSYLLWSGFRSGFTVTFSATIGFELWYQGCFLLPHCAACALNSFKDAL
jgi:hypothetical protein